LAKLRENRRRLHDDSEEESEEEDDDEEAKERDDDEDMEEKTGVSMRTPNTRRNRAEEVMVILANDEVLTDFWNYAAKRTNVAKRNMLAAKANIISAGNMVELNEGLLNGWKTAFEKLKFEEDMTVRNVGVKTLQMAERVYRRVLTEGEGSRDRRLEKQVQGLEEGMVKILTHFQLADFKTEKKMKAKIKQDRKESKKKKKVVAEVKALQPSKKREAEEAKARKEVKEELAVMEKKAKEGEELAQKVKREAERKIKELERQKQNQMSLEVIEMLEAAITQTKQTMKAVEEIHKALREAVGKDGFCLQESKAHGKVEVTVVHMNVITEEMKKQLPTKVMQVTVGLNLKLKEMGRKPWGVEAEVYDKVSKREVNWKLTKVPQDV